MRSLEFAIEMEKEGEAFYRELANQCDQKSGINYIFTMLADDESKHRRVFMSIMQSNPEMMQDTKVLQEADNLFMKLRSENRAVDCGSDQVDLYKEALDMEIKSIDLYEQALLDMDDESGKSLLKRIITEEMKHKKILENIIEHVNRPNEWIEDAEFNQKEEY